MRGRGRPAGVATAELQFLPAVETFSISGALFQAGGLFFLMNCGGSGIRGLQECQEKIICVALSVL